MTTLRKKQCVTCPFREDGYKISVGELDRIHAMLIEAGHHLCHSDETNRTICRGAREWQLEIWYRMQLIKAPTHEALIEKLNSLGVQPDDHILQGCNTPLK